VMARCLWERELPFATAELTVRYKRPFTVGTRGTARARIEKQAARLIEMSAELSGPDGTVYATAKGVFLPVRAQPTGAPT
jgi:acyl-CoA thioesterase FadM